MQDMRVHSTFDFSYSFECVNCGHCVWTLNTEHWTFRIKYWNIYYQIDYIYADLFINNMWNVNALIVPEIMLPQMVIWSSHHITLYRTRKRAKVIKLIFYSVDLYGFLGQSFHLLTIQIRLLHLDGSSWNGRTTFQPTKDTKVVENGNGRGKKDEIESIVQRYQLHM